MVQNLWDAAKAVLKGKLYSNTMLLQETREISNKQPNLTPKKNKEKTKPIVEGKKSKQSEQK